MITYNLILDKVVGQVHSLSNNPVFAFTPFPDAFGGKERLEDQSGTT